MSAITNPISNGIQKTVFLNDEPLNHRSPSQGDRLEMIPLTTTELDQKPELEGFSEALSKSRKKSGLRAREIHLDHSTVQERRRKDKRTAESNSVEITLSIPKELQSVCVFLCRACGMGPHEIYQKGVVAGLTKMNSEIPDEKRAMIIAEAEAERKELEEQIRMFQESLIYTQKGYNL